VSNRWSSSNRIVYDSEKFANALAQCRILFAKHSVFADATNKSLCDTNRTLDGQLGDPNLFDLVGFTGELEYGVSQADFNDFYEKNTFTWKFGQQTIFTQTKLTKIPQGVGPTGFNSGGTIITQGLGVVGNFSIGEPRGVIRDGKILSDQAGP